MAPAFWIAKEGTMTDPISDMLTRIRNGVSAKHARVDMPASKLKAEIARILQDEGYIQGFRIVDEAAEKDGKQSRQIIRVFLKYGPRGERVISGLERISRPGRRVYSGCGRRAAGAWRARHEHSHDVAGSDDRARGQEGGCRRGSAL